MIMRSAFIAAALALLGAIAWASGHGSLFDSVSRVVADPWGVVMMADLYAGFLVATAVFFLFERPLVALALFVALMILGNVVTLIWLAARGWEMLRRRASA